MQILATRLPRLPLAQQDGASISADLQLGYFALRLADDALIHAQRLCEWSGKAPTLEEDLALANVGLDFLGRARMLYQQAGTVFGCTEDELAYHRDSAQFSNLLLVELPRGDFAFTLVRQYLLDQFELAYFQEMCRSTDTGLGAVAAKTLKEVQYHHRRSEHWMRRLGLGTPESRTRAQQALNTLWGYVEEAFAMDELETTLVDTGAAPDRTLLREDWHSAVRTLCAQCELEIPTDDWQVDGGRLGRHTEHLGYLLGEMQVLQRTHPGLQW